MSQNENVKNDNTNNENAQNPNDKVVELNTEETEQVVGGARRAMFEKAILPGSIPNLAR